MAPTPDVHVATFFVLAPSGLLDEGQSPHVVLRLYSTPPTRGGRIAGGGAALDTAATPQVRGLLRVRPYANYI